MTRSKVPRVRFKEGALVTEIGKTMAFRFEPTPMIGDDSVAVGDSLFRGRGTLRGCGQTSRACETMLA